MHFCDICNTAATYHVANPGSAVQTFCAEHFPKFLNVNMPFVSILTQEHTRVEESVVEEPVVEVPEDVRAVPETPAPKTRKKAAAAPVEEPVTE